ncbi:MAG: sigma-70 family RNA polymerase sigma factor [Planctomycetaceae bacterium]|nr:sigma-70 family RNA polymerase sigma factor [Planctomycetaceae bacterium]
MSDQPATSLSLLIRARDGEDRAWDRLVEIYGPLVFEQCRRKGFREEDAKEITQDIFLAVSQGLPNFRRDRPDDSFLHWIRKIASRKIIDRIRRDAGMAQGTGGSSAHMRIHQVPDSISEDDWNPDDLKRMAYERALMLMQQDFQERTWQAFWLSVVEGKPTAEVSETLNMKPGTVRNARFKVQRRLIEELGDLLE